MKASNKVQTSNVKTPRVRAVKLVDMTEETVKLEIGKLKAAVNGKFIEWNNAKGDAKRVPYSLFDHKGALTITRLTDPEGFDLAVSVFNRVESERRKGDGEMVNVRSNHSIKKSTVGVTVRTTGISAHKADIACQLSDCQKLHGKLKAFENELLARAEREKQAKEAAIRAILASEVADYLNGAPGVPSTFKPDNRPMIGTPEATAAILRIMDNVTAGA